MEQHLAPLTTSNDDLPFVNMSLANVTVDAMRAARHAFMAKHSLVQSQLASFDRFVDDVLPNKIIKEQPTMVWMSPNCQFLNVLQLGCYRVGHPRTKGIDGVVHDTWPYEARMRGNKSGFTYSITTHVDYIYTRHAVLPSAHTCARYHDICGSATHNPLAKATASNAPVKAALGRRMQHDGRGCCFDQQPMYEQRDCMPLYAIPCMLRSAYCMLNRTTTAHHECSLDPGGYFIVKGAERFIVSQIVMRKNYPFVKICRNDPNALVQCDCRNLQDRLCKPTCGVHFYVSAADASVWRVPPQFKNASDAVDIVFDEDDTSVTNVHQDPFTPDVWDLPNDKPHDAAHCGIVPQLTCYIANIPNGSLTLLALCFLLGVKSRAEFAALVLESLHGEAIRSYVLQMIVAQPMVVCTAQLMHLPLASHYTSDDGTDMNADEDRIDGYSRGQIIHWMCLTKEERAMRRAPSPSPLLVDRALNAIQHELLPNSGTDLSPRTLAAKRIQLGMIIRKMVLVLLRYIPPDDQDDLVLKSAEMIGTFMARIIKPVYQGNMKRMFNSVDKMWDEAAIASAAVQQQRHPKRGPNFVSKSPIQPPVGLSIATLAERKFTKQPLQFPMSSGNWQFSQMDVLMGVSQRHVRASLLGSLANCRKFQVFLKPKSKTQACKELHGTHYGIFCANQQPDSEHCGLVNVLATYAIVRQGYDSAKLLPFILSSHVVPLHAANADMRARSVPVVVNGNTVVAYSRFPWHTMDKLKRYRRNGVIPHDVGLTWVGGPHFAHFGNYDAPLITPCNHYISINANMGGFLKTCFVVERLHRLRPILNDWFDKPCGGDYLDLWQSLFQEGVVEHVDIEEERQSRIASHLESLLDDEKFRDANNCPRVSLGSLPLISQCMPWDATVAVPRSRNAKWRYERFELHRARFTHLEFSPSSNLGLSASSLNFLESAHPARITYSVAMLNQVAGFVRLNDRYRFEGKGYQHYTCKPCKPLVHTDIDAYVAPDHLSHGGTPVTMAVISDNFDNEDAILYNRIANDLAIDSAHVICSVKAEAYTKGVDLSTFKKPQPNCLARRDANYENLNARGQPPMGSVIRARDAIIGQTLLTDQELGASSVSYIEKYHAEYARTSLQEFMHAQRANAFMSLPMPSVNGALRSESWMSAYHASCIKNLRNLLPSYKLVERDCSMISKFNGDHEVVLRAHAYAKNGAFMTRVQLRSKRITEMGDKFTTCHGQKGVVGMVVAPEDFYYAIDPCTGYAMPIQFALNPHCIPSRMTLGQKRDMIASTIALRVSGRAESGASRECRTTDEQIALMEEAGLAQSVKISVINGRTGRKLTKRVMVGVLNQQRLKHAVQDKEKSRHYGPVNNLTHQATGGRARSGGDRKGEMDIDNDASHGCIPSLQQSLYYASDPHTVMLCLVCGGVAETAPVAQGDPSSLAMSVGGYCRRCHSWNVRAFNMPYSIDFLGSNLYALGMRACISIGEHREADELCGGAAHWWSHMKSRSEGLCASNVAVDRFGANLSTRAVFNVSMVDQGLDAAMEVLHMNGVTNDNGNANGTHSPNYMPVTPPNGTSYSFAHHLTYAKGGYSPTSPAYSPTSPAYSPSDLPISYSKTTMDI